MPTARKVEKKIFNNIFEIDCSGTKRKFSCILKPRDKDSEPIEITQIDSVSTSFDTSPSLYASRGRTLSVTFFAKTGCRVTGRKVLVSSKRRSFTLSCKFIGIFIDEKGKEFLAEPFKDSD